LINQILQEEKDQEIQVKTKLLLVASYLNNFFLFFQDLISTVQTSKVLLSDYLSKRQEDD
jgi:hypothetical protein